MRVDDHGVKVLKWQFVIGLEIESFWQSLHESFVGEHEKIDYFKQRPMTELYTYLDRETKRVDNERRQRENQKRKANSPGATPKFGKKN